LDVSNPSRSFLYRFGNIGEFDTVSVQYRCLNRIGRENSIVAFTDTSAMAAPLRPIPQHILLRLAYRKLI